MTRTATGQPRRRAAGRPSRGAPGVTLVAAAALVAVAVVAVLLTWERGAGDPVTPAPAEAIRVDHTVIACPGPGRSRSVESTALIGSAALPGLGEQGRVTRGPLDGEQEAVRLGRGELVRSEVGAGDRPALVVEGRGPLAAGLFVAQADADRDAGSIALAPCAAPAPDWWFTGAGATIAHSSQLVLTNVDPGAAVVDVHLFNQDGRVESVGTRGVTIAPGEQLVVDLAEVAPQSTSLAVGVTASRGRVVAGLFDEYAAQFGDEPAAEWIPGQPAPARELLLAGLPENAGSRSVVVANPSQREAVLDVQVAGPAGSFVPTGLEKIRVAPGSVVSTDLDDALDGDVAAIRLRSRVPVVATVRSSTKSDTAYAAPVRPLRGPAAAPLIDDARSRVLLSATGKAASVEVTGLTASGEQVAQRTVEIAAGATTAYRPPARADYFVVTPGAAGVYGAVAVSGGGGRLSQLPLTELPVRLRQPPVQPVIR